VANRATKHRNQQQQKHLCKNNAINNTFICLLVVWIPAFAGMTGVKDYRFVDTDVNTPTIFLKHNVTATNISKRLFQQPLSRE